MYCIFLNPFLIWTNFKIHKLQLSHCYKTNAVQIIQLYNYIKDVCRYWYLNTVYNNASQSYLLNLATTSHLHHTIISSFVRRFWCVSGNLLQICPGAPKFIRSTLDCVGGGHTLSTSMRKENLYVADEGRIMWEEMCKPHLSCWLGPCSKIYHEKDRQMVVKFTVNTKVQMLFLDKRLRYCMQYSDAG